MLNSIYETSDFFLVRTALLPFNNGEIDQTDLFEFYHKTSLFQEAIAIASCSLYEALLQDTGDTIERQKLFPSLLKYFLRMNSRATPFGLFSGVAWGQFADKVDLSFHTETLNKKVHPDAKLSKALIDETHSQISTVSHLRVMTNPNLIKKAGRVFLKAENEKSTGLDSISIKSTLASDFIFYNAKSPLFYHELENKLITKFDEHPKEVIADYLWQVFQKGYLLSENSFSLHRPFSINEFYKTSDKNRPNSLIQAFENYSKAKFGHGHKELKIVVDEANKKKVVQHPVQVNAFRETGIFHLPHSMKERIGEAVSILWHYSQEENISLKNYQAQFQEKYGNHRLVPLMELMDPDRGLGGFLISPTQNKQQAYPSWKSAVLDSLKNKIVHLEDLSTSLSDRESAQKAPLSCELYFELLAKSDEELENGNYTLLLNPTAGSQQAGTTFGRFLYLFPDEKQEQLRSFLKKEEALLPNVAFVEASFLPDTPRLVNVAVHEKVRSFQLEMHFHDNLEAIKLEDIYVGMGKEQIYLYSRKLKKELYVSLSSAINFMLAPPVLQFLIAVSRSRFSSFMPSIWTDLEHEIFLPRICYKNVVLSTARWYVKYSDFKFSEKPSSIELEKALKDFLTSQNVPDRIYLTDLDNRLSLNWKNREHFELLLQHLTAKKELILYEVLNAKELLPVNSELGKHIAEFVIPCIKKSNHKVHHTETNYPPLAQIQHCDRVLYPGSDWLYFKLFIAQENETKFLKEHLGDFMQSLLKEQHINKWFYVRYKENKSHIRLRMQGDPIQLVQAVIPKFYQNTSQWISKGLLGDFSLHAYEREVERYGGPDCIEIAEDLFFADSENCLQILKDNSIGFPQYVLSAFGIINFVLGFYESNEEQLEFFTPYLHHKSLLTGVREHNAKAIQMAGILLYNETALDDNLTALQASFTSTRQLARRIGEITAKPSDILWNTKQSILQSILHMHCNRLLGADATAEAKAHIMAYHLLQKLHYKYSKKEVLCL
jgi:thiopeptide-type bacteriocin biosynthesis protein